MSNMGALVEIHKAKSSSLEERVQAVERYAKSVTVANDDDFDLAALVLTNLKRWEKEAKEFMGPVVKAAHDAHKEAKAKENALVMPLRNALIMIGEVMGKYQEACERERVAQQAAMQAAEQEELDTETLDRATQLEEQGLKAEAKAVLAAAPKAQVKLPSYAAKAKGTQTRRTWKFEIVDASLIPREYLVPDEKKIGAVVRALKDSACIYGVRVYSETAVSARG